jgi:SAM-dependent methyltransferase
MQLSPLDADLLPRLPLSARTILDVGCGSGALTAAYRLLNPQARILGIDVDPVAAALAARHMDQVAIADVQAESLPFELPDDIDCIIYNGILEHLRDPWALVQRHARKLGAEGMMLICIANVEYWRIAARLLRGGWLTDTDDAAGYEAPSRLAWLDPHAVRENLTQAGLWLCDVTGRAPDREAAARFAASLGPALGAAGIDPRDYARRASTSHLIWRVRQQPQTRLIVCGSMLEPIGGVSDVRVVHPLQAMGTDPLVTAGICQELELTRPADDTPRVFVLHRPALIGDRGHEVLGKLDHTGFLVVTEFDDLPDRFDMMRLGGALSFYGAHALQTSTIPMADALRQYNPHVAVFPNAVGRLQEVSNFADPNGLTFFFGALNREPDWVPFMPSINAVAAIAGDRLKFQVVHDRGFFDALETPHKSFTGTCDYATYLRLLGQSEISFMPLADTPFNRAKSDLKFIEAGSCRVAALASTVVYSGSVEDGRTGLLFSDPAEFHAALSRLMTIPELARGLGDAARQYVAEYRMLAYQVAPRIAWYRMLWANRQELDAARRERVMSRRQLETV